MVWIITNASNAAVWTSLSYFYFVKSQINFVNQVYTSKSRLINLFWPKTFIEFSMNRTQYSSNSTRLTLETDSKVI